MSAELKPSPFRVGLALFSLYIIWGSTYLAMRYAVEGYAPFRMAGVRFLAAGGLLFLYLLAKKTPLPSAKQVRSALLVSGLMLVLGNGLIAVTERHVASSIAAVMVASMPLFAAVYAGFLGKWPSRAEALGLALGSLGVVLLNLDGDLRANPLGAICLVIAPAAWALGSVASARLELPRGMMSSAVQMIAAGIFMLLLSFVVPAPPGLHPDLRSMLAVVYLIVFGSLVGYTAYGFLLRNVRPAVATSYAFVNPAVAVLLGVGVAHETLTPKAYLGMAFIVGAVGMIILTRNRKPAQ